MCADSIRVSAHIAGKAGSPGMDFKGPLTLPAEPTAGDFLRLMVCIGVRWPVILSCRAFGSYCLDVNAQEMWPEASPMRERALVGAVLASLHCYSRAPVVQRACLSGLLLTVFH